MRTNVNNISSALIVCGFLVLFINIAFYKKYKNQEKSYWKNHLIGVLLNLIGWIYSVIRGDPTSIFSLIFIMGFSILGILDLFHIGKCAKHK